MFIVIVNEWESLITNWDSNLTSFLLCRHSERTANQLMYS